MIGFKTMVIRTNYKNTLSFSPWQVDSILSADLIQVRDIKTDVILINLKPSDVIQCATKIPGKAYKVFNFSSRVDYAPNTRKL